MQRVIKLFFLCLGPLAFANEYSLEAVLAPLSLRPSAPLMPHSSPFHSLASTSTPEIIAYQLNPYLLSEAESKNTVFIATLAEGKFTPVQKIKLARNETLRSLKIIDDQFLRIEVSQWVSHPKRDVFDTASSIF